MFSWMNPRNWLGERPSDEMWRRLEATEGNATEAHLRLNDLENRINLLWSIIAPTDGSSDEPV